MYTADKVLTFGSRIFQLAGLLKLFYEYNECQELSLDEIDNVAGGSDTGWTCEAVCPVNCGFVKVFDSKLQHMMKIPVST